jgi:vacuolar-type H+-ATPase subunit E/Vma4
VVNKEPIVREFGEQLDLLGAKAVQTESGDFVLDFSGSQISQNKTAQKVIKQVYALLNEPQPVDALRMHNLKRQLDEIIDYKKSIGKGLSTAGQRVIRNVRQSLNDEIRRVSNEANLGYSEVNDSLSELLTLFDDLDNVTGSTTNILDSSAAQKMGQQFRKTMSNYGVRTDLLNAIQQLDSMAAKYGGKFNDDMLDLAMFANALDTRFEPVASTSFRGEIVASQKQAAREQAMRTAARGDVPEMLAGKLMESYQKLRGINDEQAYKVMEELLRAGLNE